MTNKFICPMCEYGYIQVMDEGGIFYDACYHCQNTGWVNYDPDLSLDEINGLLQEIANEEIMKNWDNIKHCY